MLAMALVAGLFGLIIGSFTNVLVLRFGARGLGGRSSCPRCGHLLAWYDLVPVLSWIALRGRCRYCGTRISVQYPLVEILMAVLFALVWHAPFPAAPLFRVGFAVIIVLLVAIAVYDMRHTIIPDPWVYSFAGLALLIGASMTPHYLIPLLIAGPLSALPLLILWGISRGRWMGFGDVKLALGMGWLLGPIAGPFSVLFAFVLGSATLVPLMLAARAVTHMRTRRAGVVGLTMKSEVPFGPFLIASTLIIWIALLYGFDIPALAGW